MAYYKRCKRLFVDRNISLFLKSWYTEYKGHIKVFPQSILSDKVAFVAGIVKDLFAVKIKL